MGLREGRGEHGQRGGSRRNRGGRCDKSPSNLYREIISSFLKRKKEKARETAELPNERLISRHSPLLAATINAVCSFHASINAQRYSSSFRFPAFPPIGSQPIPLDYHAFLTLFLLISPLSGSRSANGGFNQAEILLLPPPLFEYLSLV